MHGTGAGNGTEKQMGYYIFSRTVHITLGQGTGPDTIWFHTIFSVPVPTPIRGVVSFTDPPSFNLAPANLFQLSCCCEWDPPLT